VGLTYLGSRIEHIQ